MFFAEGWLGCVGVWVGGWKGMREKSARLARGGGKERLRARAMFECVEGVAVCRVVGSVRGGCERAQLEPTRLSLVNFLRRRSDSTCASTGLWRGQSRQCSYVQTLSRGKAGLTRGPVLQNHSPPTNPTRAHPTLSAGSW